MIQPPLGGKSYATVIDTLDAIEGFVPVLD